MQDKYENSINSLPVELVQKIAGELKPKEALHFALASKQTLFNVRRNLIINKEAHDMSTLVAYGKQEEVQDLLAKSPNAQELLVTPASFSDYSGRTFHCTAYEYAYWSKDTHMRRMLEQLMGKDTKAQLLERCEAIEKHGLRYHQNGKEYCTKYFDFTPLKAALSNYIQGYNNWTTLGNLTGIEVALTAIGRAQQDAPVHIINEYCRPDRSFKPTPTFKEDELPRVLTYFNYKLGEIKSFFPLVASDSSGIVADIALIRGGSRGQVAAGELEGCVVAAVVRVDLLAVSQLDEVRTADLMRSRENLSSAEREHYRGMTY